eukprot:10286671-Alexandrium_andersonii.AAC.1
MLSSQSPKLWRRLMRNRTIPRYIEYALPLQCGGVRAKGTDTTILQLRAIQRIDRKPRAPMFVVFVDVVSAFCSVPRQHVLPECSGRVDWQAVASDLNFPDSLKAI